MKIPYQMVAAVDNYRRHAQMAVAILSYNFPRLQKLPVNDLQSITIACYGPSLQDTYQTMKRPIMSMSGATKWLVERGITPDYHIDMDPRPNKVEDVTPAFKDVNYLMASVCHPDVFKALEGYNVTLWHVYSSDDTNNVVGSLDNGEFVIRGGSTIGLTAMHVAGMMGYRHLEIHGMDGSFKDETRTERHAGYHSGQKQNKDGIVWSANNKVYATSRIMANAVAETINAVKNFPIFCVFHGNGLTQALVRKYNFPNACCADEIEKAEKIRKMTANVIGVVADENTAVAVWDALSGPINPDIKTEMAVIHQANEARRVNANYNTGSITVEQMVQLRQMTQRLQLKTIVEIGTFIGNSAMAMVADKIYTCDRDNDCLPTTPNIITHPRTESTKMLSELVARGVKADMFFFDGRIQLPDLPMILKLSHPGTIYVFDDYVVNAKGVANVTLLSPLLPSGSHNLVQPDSRVTKSTLAMLVPMRMFTRKAA